MVSYFFQLLSLLIFAQSLSMSAFASEALLCKSDMPIYGFQGTQAVLLNENTDEFLVANDKYLFIRVGIGAKHPIVDILPWGGITYKQKKINFLKVQVKTDNTSYISVLITSVHTKIATKMDCFLKDTTFARQPQALNNKGARTIKNQQLRQKGNPSDAY